MGVEHDTIVLRPSVPSVMAISIGHIWPFFKNRYFSSNKVKLYLAQKKRNWLVSWVKHDTIILLSITEISRSNQEFEDDLGLPRNTDISRMFSPIMKTIRVLSNSSSVI